MAICSRHASACSSSSANRDGEGGSARCNRVPPNHDRPRGRRRDASRQSRFTCPRASTSSVPASSGTRDRISPSCCAGPASPSASWRAPTSRPNPANRGGGKLAHAASRCPRRPRRRSARSRLSHPDAVRALHTFTASGENHPPEPLEILKKAHQWVGRISISANPALSKMPRRREGAISWSCDPKRA